MNHSKISTRFFANLVDSIIISAVNTAIHVACVKLIPGFGELISSILSLVFLQFYVVKSIQKTGQTLGKKLLGVQIVFETIEPTAWMVVKREFIFKIVSLAFFFLGYIWAIFDPNKQSWHDKLAKTEVISLETEEEAGSSPLLKWLPLIGLPALFMGLVFVFLFTSAPLTSLHTQFESAGLKMDSINGSIMGGIEVKNLEGDFGNFAVELETLTFKVDFIESLVNKKMIISNATAENGYINSSLGLGVPALQNEKPVEKPNANKETPKKLDLPVAIGLFRLKNINFKQNNTSTLMLNLFEIKTLELSKKKISFDQIQFNTEKISLSLEDALIEPEKKKAALNGINGHLSPALSSILRKNLNFALHTQNPQGAKIKVAGEVAGAKISGTWGEEKKELKVTNFNLTEYLTVSLPIENFNLNLKLENKSIPTYESTFSICNKEFHLKGFTFVFSKNDKTYYVQPVIPAAPNTAVTLNATQPSEGVSKEATNRSLGFDEKKTAAEYFPIQLVPDTKNGTYTSFVEAASDFCFEKPSSQLSSEELTVATNIAKSIKFPTPKVDVQMANSPSDSAATIAQFQAAYSQSKSLFVQGKPQEALNVLQNIAPPPGIAKDQQIVFLRHLAWLNLMYGDSRKSAMWFVILYSDTQNISDAEGALRSFEKTNDQENKEKWNSVIKAKLAEDPTLKEKLSGNFRRSIASE